jgi:hypothetical protein
MKLLDMWFAARAETEAKHVRQIIAFAGDGNLRDASDCSSEFRAFLSQVPAELLKQYAEECLTSSFEKSGETLQDVVNEIGRRLGFEVEGGRYRGTSNEIGFDGLWRSHDGHAIVAETKTTDVYQINLEVVANYRKSLVARGDIDSVRSSILIIVGRQATDGLEAQVRGSRHAWDVRLISVDALSRLMLLKQDMVDPQILEKVRAVLVPREFTRVDGIIELVFSAAQDIKEQETTGEEDEGEDRSAKFTPVAFHQACIGRIERSLRRPLVTRSKAIYGSTDGSLTVFCGVSKEHVSAGSSVFWYAFHPHQKAALERAKEAYVAFGCGSADTVVMLPFQNFLPLLDGMHQTTTKDGRSYWHVKIYRDDGRFVLHRASGYDRVDLTASVLPASAGNVTGSDASA